MNRRAIAALLLLGFSSGSFASAQESNGSSRSELKVEVRGSVKKPGTYKLPVGAMITDAIDAAGGPSDGPSGGGYLRGVRLVRAGKTTVVDVRKIISHGVANITLDSCDTIQVPEALF